MKVGTIYENKWSGYKKYFMYMGASTKYKNEPRKVKGIQITLLDTNDTESWVLEMDAEYYKNSLKDEAYFPAVGHVDIKKAIKDAILSGIRKGELPHAIKMSNWIPCEKREPTECGEYWVCYEDGSVAIGYWIGGDAGGRWACGVWIRKIIAWQPLQEPEPYEPREDDR